ERNPVRFSIFLGETQERPGLAVATHAAVPQPCVAAKLRHGVVRDHAHKEILRFERHHPHSFLTSSLSGSIAMFSRQCVLGMIATPLHGKSLLTCIHRSGGWMFKIRVPQSNPQDAMCDGSSS